MGRTLDRSVLVGVGLVVALLVLTAGLTYWNTRQLNDDAGWVAQAHEMLDLTTDVLLSLIDAETAERGFIIAGGNEYLQPYDASIVKLNERLATLKDKTKDNAFQQDRIQKLEAMIAERVATLQRSIDLRRTGEGRIRMYLQLVSKGKEQMDAVREVVDELQREEHVELNDRQRQSSSTYRVAVMTGLGTALLGLVMVGACVWLLNRSLWTREMAATVVREQREWFRTTLASIGDAVIATDTEGRVAFLNGVAETLTGWKQDEAKGQPLESVFHIVNEESRRVVENPAIRALREGQIVGLANHTRLIARDGTERTIDDSAAPIQDDKGHVAGAVLIFRDITEQRRLEKELRIRAEELADADQRKNEFLAMLAHELRNPLAPIRNALQILRVAGSNGETFAQVQGIMERQLGQMVRLVDDLLDVSRISRGKIDLRRERLDVAHVIESALETSRPLIEAARHHLIVNMPPQPVSVMGDLTRLAQVLSNLLNNSAKYTPEAGHIWLTVERQGAHVVIRVRDDGMGIPAAMLPGIFEMFTQADRSLHRAQGGLGIGLTLVRRLVELHGGTIEAHSAGEGKGAEFVTRLLLAPDEADTPTAPRDDGAAVVKLPARRILVVDDNQDSAESLGMLLKLLGNDTRAAADGPSALAAGREFLPDVVLLDIGLPGMSGYEVARRMRALPELRNAILVAQTGWGQDEDRRRSKDAGFDEHLVKPIDMAVLQRLLASLRQPGTSP